MQDKRIILHIDMDAFYASVETRDNPSLKGKPLVIGSLPGERGVVATCNYKAREYGIRSAMPINQAYRLCEHAHFMYPNMKKYQEASEKIHDILETFTDVFEYIALDEGFLDITESVKLFGGAQEIARQIKHRIWNELRLTCSIGLGYSKSSAKLASEENKPNGYYEIMSPDALKKLIASRNVRIVYTVGEKTAQRLERIGINSVEDIYKNPERIKNVFGKHGDSIVKLANGIDNRKVGTRTKRQSLGTETTFQKDVTDEKLLKNTLRVIARNLAIDVRKKDFLAKTVTLKITYAGMQTITRSFSAGPTNDALQIYTRIEKLFDKIKKKPIRLIGITLSNFINPDEVVIEKKPIQLSLFEEQSDEMIGKVKINDKRNKLENVVKSLQEIYGEKILKSGSELDAENFIRNNNKKNS